MQNWKNINFLNSNLVINPKIMVSIHVEENFDLIMNESQIFSKDKGEKERFKKFETLQSSQSRNYETLHLILKILH